MPFHRVPATGDGHCLYHAIADQLGVPKDVLYSRYLRFLRTAASEGVQVDNMDLGQWIELKSMKDEASPPSPSRSPSRSPLVAGADRSSGAGAAAALARGDRCARYADFIERNRAWGTDLDIFLVATMLQRPILVYKAKRGAGGTLEVERIATFLETAPGPYVALLASPGHYDGLKYSEPPDGDAEMASS